ncbi:MAG: IS1182 family transposase ISAcma46 [Chroococcidiopsis sp. SAG 2025]|nr:IS1182 family transposase ISAcma46 [Chroococcidiopsis sp. SAG 2025]
MSEFRTRLIAGNAEQVLLDKLLEQLRSKGLLKGHKRQRTDSTHVLAAIRILNRLETLGETFRAALNSLAVVAPNWLAAHLQDAWFERYSRRLENYRLPKLDDEREELGRTIGKDGFALLDAIYDGATPEWMRQIPAVETLRRVWMQQFYAPTEDGSVQWRSSKDMPPSTLAIHSPYDVEAHYSSKRSVDWVGYKVHITETCDQDCPHFITEVCTTLSTIPDDAVVESVHQTLSEKSLLPEEHLMDTGYVTADHIVNTQVNYGIELIGKVRINPSWQTQSNSKFSADQFEVDWDNQIVTCPKGHQSIIWRPKIDNRGLRVVHVHFSQADCRRCPVRKRCTHSNTARRLSLPPQAKYNALRQRRRVQETSEFKQLYQQRAGVEGTLSQGVRRSALRQSRYVGLAKTHLQHILIATALNLIRWDAWLSGIPLARTRYSRFMELKSQIA